MEHAAKTCVKKAKKVYIEELYRKLESREGELDIYRIARGRAESAKDMKQFYHVNNTEYNREMADVLQINVVTSADATIPPADPMIGPAPLKAAVEAITKTKNDKASGPDDIPNE
ncbi:unnamed protein product [Strongylus vulgaris]|uniref:Uncharacterized protein n=1 Tax=Strongylus vulgaris TaxID=40348 RepID=A0A3P7IYY8_STRVU|nr:unnamed protein product [Strongylus vulgaris]